MGRDDEEIEIRGEPAFLPGSKVRCTKRVRNDGTVAGREIGEILVRKGEIGYVRDVGTFLTRYYIYVVEFVERGTIVGMRARELSAMEAT
jgi:nitrogen fixation protein NifZ